jgi:hypothetical protein
MSRSVPVQTNINVDTTFYSREPPGPTQCSTLLAGEWISTANLVTDLINGLSPNDTGPISTMTVGDLVSTPQIYISTINGAPPAQAEAIGNDPFLSSVIVGNYLSTQLLEVGTVNSQAPLISSLTLPENAALSTIEAHVWMSTLKLGDDQTSSISTVTMVGGGIIASGGGMKISTLAVSTASINARNLSTNYKYFPGPIITGRQNSASGTYSTIVTMPYVFPGPYAVISKAGDTQKTEIQSPSTFIFHSYQTLPIPIRYLAAAVGLGPAPFS